MSSMLRVTRELGKSAALIGSRRGLTAIPSFLGNSEKLKKRLPLAKIVATIGPASEQAAPLKKVFEAGMRIMRINFSHATYEEAALRMRNLNACRGVNIEYGHDATGAYTNMRSIMLDTQGPEIRTGSFEGVKEMELKAGQEVILDNDEVARFKQTPQRLWISYKKLGETVQEGSQLLLDDGAIILKVTAKKDDQIVCTVQNSAMLGNKKGVNLPGLVVDLPPMSEKDKADIRWGLDNDIDYIAASFIRKPSDVTEIREFCREHLAEKGQSSRPLPRIISKIESTEALLNFDDILEASDGIMVARGDLAVEIPIETLANVQKEIVHRCNRKGKPVIVATQMLESMQKNPRPTRAEALDVANAIFDGADCVMLSGESANGKYPKESVDMMQRIVHQAELGLVHSIASDKCAFQTTETKGLDMLQSMAHAAVQVSGSRANIAAIVVNVTNSSSSSMLEVDSKLAQAISSLKPNVPVVCLVPSYKAGRLLQMHRGLHPILAPLKGTALSPSIVKKMLTRLEVIGKDDDIVCLSGSSEENLAMQIVSSASAH